MHGPRPAVRIACALALLFLLAAPLLSPPADARLKMERYSFKTAEWIHIGLELDGVTIEDVKFHEAPKVKGIVTRHDKPNRATIVARNRSNEKVDAGAAIAVFDAEGTLLAAGNTGVTTGVLQPGERHEFDVHFASVFRDIDRASYFLITLEY